jgi:transcriptional regulator with XRE-family HTH domain
MARAALGLGVRELAAAAKVSADTVARFERGDALKDRTVEALQRALELAGVEFTNGERPGVRLIQNAVGNPVQRVGEPNRMPDTTAPDRNKRGPGKTKT